MSNRSPDQSQFPEVVVVDASAGSGKTYCLAKRYLQLLINPYLNLEQVPLRNILAITFTNKATVEMKERIIELLKKISLDAFSNSQEERDILDTLGVDKEFAKEKAFRIMDELTNHYNFFQIQTIDSFINTILLGCAFNIERSASFKIKRDYTQYLSYCLDLVIEEAVINQDVFKFFEEFLEHYLFVENRTGWFPKEDILELMESLFRLSNKYGELFRVHQGESKDVIKKKKYIYKLIKDLSSHFPQDFNANSKKHIQSFLNKSKDILDISDLPVVLKNPKVPMNKAKPVPLGFEKKWKIIHKELIDLMEFDAKVAYNPYVKLFQKLLDFFQIVSRKEDILFLEELNRKVRLIFGDGGVTVAEVYYRLAVRFKHYLIDEFQDTSILQWHNLELMIEEALSCGGSLFYVGDKKQAIYRFRGGEAKLFDDVKSRFNQFNVKHAHLTKNWRSQKAIVEFNNKVFSEKNLLTALKLSGIVKELEYCPGAVDGILDIFKDAIQQHREENTHGYVRVERIDEKNRQERDCIMCPKIINLIGELQTRFKYEDIAILTRDNSEVELITSWLLGAGIPVESEKTLNILENQLIKNIVSFLKFLYSPPDDLSFASFILGEVFSRTTGISVKDVTEFLFNLHKEEKLSSGISLYRLFRSKYPDIWSQYIERFFKNVGFISCYELVTGIYERFGILRSFKNNQAFFMKFLELIKSKEDEYVGLGEFISYLDNALPEDLYVNVSRSDSVKILTIHKSKGLEFGVVIIPFLRMDISPQEGGKNTSSYVVGEDDETLELIRITKNHRSYSKNLQKIYSQSYKKACIDELNNMYVALTRPQYELYVFIPKKSGSGNNKARFIIPQNLIEFGAKRIPGGGEKSSQPLVKMSPSIYKDWIEVLKDEFGDAEKIKNREKIMEGNIMHLILSQVKNCVGQDIDKMLKKIFKTTQILFPFIQDCSFYKEKIKKLFKEEELQDVFYVLDGEVICEKEVVNEFGDIKRIDRLIIKKNEVVVIDYKASGGAFGEHKKQIAEYMRIIKDIYSTRNIKGLLIYLDDIRVEEVNV